MLLFPLNHSDQFIHLCSSSIVSPSTNNLLLFMSSTGSDLVNPSVPSNGFPSLHILDTYLPYAASIFVASYSSLACMHHRPMTMTTPTPLFSYSLVPRLTHPFIDSPFITSRIHTSLLSIFTIYASQCLQFNYIG